MLESQVLPTTGLYGIIFWVKFPAGLYQVLRDDSGKLPGYFASGERCANFRSEMLVVTEEDYDNFR